MNKIKVLTLGLVFSIFGMLVFANSVDAAVCSKTWNGQTYSYNYSSSGSNGTFVFNNWASTQYNVTINVVGKVTTCLSQTDFNKMMSWSYNSDAQAFWNTGLNSWSRNLSCGNTHTYSKVHIPVNGSCGSADGTTVSSAPSTNLCSSGTATAVSSNNSTYTWTCYGQYGGTNDACGANKQVVNNLDEDDDDDNSHQNNSNNPNSNAYCQISEGESLMKLGEPVTLTAAQSDSGTTYLWSGNGMSGTSQTITVNSSVPRIFNLLVLVSKAGTNRTLICPEITYELIPTIKLVPPITQTETCVLDINTDNIPGAVCSVYVDGVVDASLSDGSAVPYGKKYQVKCTYTPVDGTLKTVESTVKSCAKNPSLIEI